MADEPCQFWVRSDKGTVWGPLTYATIELFIANGLIEGRLQASLDGINFVFPGRLPELRDAFPRELWGVDSDEPRPPSAGQNAPGVSPVVPPPVGAHLAPAPAPPPVLRREPPPAARGAAADPPKAAAQAAAPPKPGRTQAEPPAGLGARDELPAGGDLGALSPLHLYYRAAARGFTGRLALSSGSTGYEIFFKKGAPEAVRPSRSEEDLGSFLVERGGLSPGALEDARTAAASQGGDVVAGLFLLQLINPAQAFMAIGEHAVGLLRRALALRAGTFTVEAGAALPNTAMPLGDRWALVCDAVRAFPAAEIRARLGERFDQPIMRSGGRVELSQLRLTPQEARAASTFDGVHSIAALIASMPGEADALARTALLMASFEMVSFGQGAPAGPAARGLPPGGEEKVPATERQEAPPSSGAGPRPAPAAAPRAPPRLAPSSSPGSPGSPARPTGSAPGAARQPAGSASRPQAPPAPRPPPGIPGAPPKLAPAPPAAVPGAPAADMVAAASDPAKLRELASALKSKDHFEVLGVPKEALGSQVKQAYFALAKVYHPDTVQAGSAPELARLKAEVFSRIGEAYRVLGDDKARAAYLEELKSGGQEEQVDAAAIFAAEEAFQKGCILVRARKYPEALAMLEEAVRVYDKEGEFWAWRGWAGFLAANEKAMARAAALKDIDLGIKLNPKCAQAYYFAGQILKLTGDPAGALKWFKKAVQVDPKHIDAQREIRMAGGR